MFGNCNTLPVMYDLANVFHKSLMKPSGHASDERENLQRFSRKRRISRDASFLPQHNAIKDDLHAPKADELEKLPELESGGGASKSSDQQLTRDKIEDLAISDLNGTISQTIVKDENGLPVTAYPLKQQNIRSDICSRFMGDICLHLKIGYPENEILRSIRRHVSLGE